MKDSMLAHRDATTDTIRAQTLAGRAALVSVGGAAVKSVANPQR